MSSKTRPRRPTAPNVPPQAAEALGRALSAPFNAAEQPRVPAGHPHGGRWTALANSLWHPATLPLKAGIALYNVLTARAGEDTATLLEFRAEHFAEKKQNEIAYVGQLTRAQAQQVCTGLSTVQDLLDDAVKNTNRSAYASRQTYGTAIHKSVETNTNNNPALKSFRAERSWLKALLESDKLPDPEIDPADPDPYDPKSPYETRYGRSGTIRVDVYQTMQDEQGTVCVYDLKTGNRGMSLPRISEFAYRAKKVFPNAKRVIVMEVRPDEGTDQSPLGY
jgi:hypothetical protein